MLTSIKFEKQVKKKLIFELENIIHQNRTLVSIYGKQSNNVETRNVHKTRHSNTIRIQFNTNSIKCPFLKLTRHILLPFFLGVFFLFSLGQPKTLLHFFFVLFWTKLEGTFLITANLCISFL